MDAVVEDAGVGSGGGASGLEEEGHETITMGDMHTCEKYNYLQHSFPLTTLNKVLHIRIRILFM